MKTYHQNGTVSVTDHILSDGDRFAIQCEMVNAQEIVFYPNDGLVWQVDAELAKLHSKFQDLYFSDWELYKKESLNLPLGLVLSGQNSDLPIDKVAFLHLKKQMDPFFIDLNRHLYVGDCQYLVSTVQNLLHAAEYCFIEYYRRISQVELHDIGLKDDDIYWCSSRDSMDLVCLLETFFTKLYSTLDVLVKIVWELENPIEKFESLSKLRSSEKLWGDRKRLNVHNSVDTVFEDCIVIKQIESLRNEAVHNGAWEFRPKIFVKVESERIVERYMLFPDFDEGRLSTVKNRRHFFSQEIKANDALVSIHDEFYRRLLITLKKLLEDTSNNS